ncbi:MAG: HK97 gp10 family phage protein [Endomicrobiales bacterium]|nr:HK97 gp10 family phage protein [Endomicrobiales bacterium]
MSVESFWLGDAIKKGTRIACNNAAKKVCLLAEKEAKKNASGRPGPNVQTGRLRASITHLVAEPNENNIIGVIGAGGGLEYAEYVEFGTSRAAAYPFLRPAVDAAMKESESIFAKEIKEVLA